MSSFFRRRQRAKSNTMFMVALVSLLLHGGAGLIVSTFDLNSLTPRPEEAAVSVVDDVPFAYACSLDVAAMTTARLVYCSSPFSGDRGACAADALAGFANEQILCEQQKIDMPALSALDPASISLVDPALLAQIDPKPLLPALPNKAVEELMKQEEEKIEEKHEEAVKRESSPSVSGQVVEITKPKIEISPDKARFVSEFDSKTDKETVARATTEKMVERPGKSEVVASSDPKIMRPNPGAKSSSPEGLASDALKNPGASGRAGDRGLLAMRDPKLRASRLMTPTVLGQKLGQRLSTTDGFEPVHGDRGRMTPDPQSRGDGGDGGENGGLGTRPNLMPRPEMVEQMVGGGSVDKLDGVESGDSTALNSRRWKFASFFNRMKRRVAQNWHPAEAFMRRDPTGRVYGTKDRITVLRVSLNPGGALADVIISQSSGVDFLDEEAVRAFRAAQPFPNPPGALVDKDSQVITFSFGFHFQIGGSSDSWRIFRTR